MLPWSLGSAARRLAAATRAASASVTCSPAPARRWPCPPDHDQHLQRTAVWVDVLWPPHRPGDRRRLSRHRLHRFRRLQRARVLRRSRPSSFRVRREFSCTTKASRDHSGLTRQLLDFQHDTVHEIDREYDPFRELKARFMDFKQRNYVENFSNYQNLAQQQAPKFMVIACADSRVCPSSILGFQPGEAFTVRNVANLVPPYQHGASETSAALEFAVNSLQVENVLVVGHSRCGGIEALMSMKSKKDDSDSRSFIRDWVSIGKSARLSTEAAAGNLSFESQCIHCEKESINSSLLNLLTYPWIEKRVNEGTLSLHGGYYNFVDCTFEKWTLVYRQGLEGGSKYAIKNRSTWY